MMKKNNLILTICIPVFNEERTLGEIVDKLFKVRFLQKNVYLDVIIINDCSTDGTLAIVNKLLLKYQDNIRLINNEQRMGKSYSLKKGILNADPGSDFVVCQDADLEYEPNDLSQMLCLLVSKNYDVAFGNRFGLQNKVIYRTNYYGNLLLSLFSSFFTTPRIKVLIPDIEVCYKMIKTNVAKNIAKNIISKSNFGIEPEMTIRLSKYKINNEHLKFTVTPTHYYPRTYTEGKKINSLKDGLICLYEIIKFNVIV